MKHIKEYTYEIIEELSDYLQEYFDKYHIKEYKRQPPQDYTSWCHWYIIDSNYNPHINITVPHPIYVKLRKDLERDLEFIQKRLRMKIEIKCYEVPAFFQDGDPLGGMSDISIYLQRTKDARYIKLYETHKRIPYTG